MPLARCGRIPLRLGVDERCLRAVGIDRTRRGQGRDDAPAQVGVDHQTRQFTAAGSWSSSVDSTAT